MIDTHSEPDFRRQLLRQRDEVLRRYNALQQRLAVTTNPDDRAAIEDELRRESQILVEHDHQLAAPARFERR